MKDAAHHTGAFIAQARRRGAVLLLDFDGTLSPIVADHRRAIITATARKALARLARHLPVAVISGRSSADVRRRVAVEGLRYVGCHGLEEFKSGRVCPVPVPARAGRSYAHARRQLSRLAREFRLRVEDKRCAYALHYRGLPAERRREFLRQARAIVAPFVGRRELRVLEHEYAFDVMPEARRSKGTAARSLARSLGGRGALAIYIGDGATDEDAFRSLTGATIRVGRTNTSAARYYFRSRRDVDVFLRRLARALA